MEAIRRIGFIGLGRMGLPMSSNLLRAGYSVKGYQFSWNANTGATRYELLEDPDGAAGPLPEMPIGGAITGTSYGHSLAGKPLHERANAS